MIAEKLANDAKAKIGATATLMILSGLLTWMVNDMRDDFQTLAVSMAQAQATIKSEAEKVSALDARVLRVEQRLQQHIEEAGPRLADWRKVFESWIAWMEANPTARGGRR